jgi:hypothetical protein
MTIPVAPEDLRQGARKRVLMNATIIGPEGRHQARVVDLTVSGVQILCNHRLEKDWDVIFKRGDMFVAARVAWATRTGAGLEFYRKSECSAL